ncbi:glycosyltransferase [Grimontia sp. S25]|uniref:Glycosyltransferase n=1 Tax=Grimontia sedimenti TaxID=2711294 RepID=A0A6M1RFR5_9GAMM|nr:glycosyltransferase [Grimontia sedimenti]
MKVSLIIATYNWEQALAAVLHSLKLQSKLPDEVIIADDGSKEATANLIADCAKDFPVPLIHSWQPDDGFRLAESRNRAFAKATGNYYIMIDGDLILPPRFIEDHIINARPNQFIQGGRVIMEPNCSENTLLTRKLPSLLSKGIRNRHNSISNRFISGLFSKISNSDKSTRGCNMSFWADDFKRVNGFNNDFVGWGREDSEFVHRMLNSGINRLYLKFAGAGFHIYHDESPRESLPANDIILTNTVEHKLKRCQNGVDKFIEHTL